MNRTRRLLGRLQQGVEGAVNATRSTPEQDDGRTTAPPSDKAPSSDVRRVLEALNKLSPNKQAKICEYWPGATIELDHGITVTARSTKERRRFVRSMDAEMLGWLRGLAAGDVFFDIGANCGSLTLTAGALHRGTLTVVAIEPGYANFESLARNLSHNGMLGFVIPLQVALLDRTRLEPINYHRTTMAGTSLHAVGRPVDHEGKEFTPVETQMVMAYALDDLIDMLGLPEPTHVKVDVDGAEEPLLYGATKTLQRGVIKELLVEIVDHDRAGTRLAAVRSFLARHGYELAASYRHHPDNVESFVADHLFRRSSRTEAAATSQ